MSLSLTNGVIVGLSSINSGPLIIGLVCLVGATTLAYYQGYRAKTRRPYGMLMVGVAALAPGIPLAAATTQLALQTPGTHTVIKLAMIFGGVCIGIGYGYTLKRLSDRLFERRKEQFTHKVV